jgi:hypothetical protein
VEKAFKIGKTSAAGSYRLLIGVAASTIILGVGSILLRRLLERALSQTIPLTLTLSVANSPTFIHFLMDNKVTSFSFDIIISAIEQTQ